MTLDRPYCEGTQCAQSFRDLCDPGDGIPVKWNRTQQPGLPGGEEAEKRRLQLDISEAQSRQANLGVAARHIDLIEGMTKIYNTLLKMRYFMSVNLWRLPHHSPPLAFQALETAGYTPEVVEVMQQLLYLDPSTHCLGGVQVAPNSTAIAYTNPGHEVEYSRDPFLSGFNDIAPWSFRLTKGGGLGIHYIYNTQDCTFSISLHPWPLLTKY